MDAGLVETLPELSLQLWHHRPKEYLSVSEAPSNKEEKMQCPLKVHLTNPLRQNRHALLRRYRWNLQQDMLFPHHWRPIIKNGPDWRCVSESR